MGERKIKPRKRRVLGELKRNRRLTMNLTAQEFEQLELKADEAGIAMAVYARRVSLSGVVVARLGPEDRELFRAVVGVSNTLNELCRLSKAEGVERVTERFVAGRDAVDGLINKLKL